MNTEQYSTFRIEKIAEPRGSCHLCLLPQEFAVNLKIQGSRRSVGVSGRQKQVSSTSVFAYCGYHFIKEMTENPAFHEAIRTQTPEVLGMSELVSRPSVGSTLGIEDLIAQLEESKFMRFFREFALDEMEPERTTVPLDFPDVEIFLTTFEDQNSGVFFNAFDQFVHLPANLWQPEFTTLFVEKNLRQAFRNLAYRQDLLPALDGSGTLEKTSTFFNSREEQIPEEYSLFTNIPDDVLISQKEMSEYASILCHRMLDIPLQHCPNFHLITPGSIMAAPGANRVKEFLVDLLNTPSSYYFVAREGRISVASTAEHGTFFASGADGRHLGPPVSAVVTSTLPTSQVLTEIETLLNAPTSKERDIQEFLERHPELLFAFDERYCEIRPHVCLVDDKGERLIPDFMARLHGSNLWEVIELKMPRHPLTVRHGRTEKPSAQAARAIAELLAYRDFFSVRSNRYRLVNRFGTAPYEPCLVLVIGRGRSRDRYIWESSRPGFPKVQIVSYDYMFKRAREIRRAFSIGAVE